MEALLFCILLSSPLAASHDPFLLFSEIDLKAELCDYDQFIGDKFCDKSDTKILPLGSRYAITDCVAYVTPYEDLSSHLCPFIIPAMTGSDNKCHTFFYSNNSIYTLNFVAATPPIQLVNTTGAVISPYKDTFMFIYCPLYGYPHLNYSWRVPIRGVYYSGLDLYSLEAYKENSSIPHPGDLSLIFIDEICPTAVSIIYTPLFVGTFSCTGTNYLGSKTITVATVDDSAQCVNKDNTQFFNSSDRVFNLASDYKVPPAEFSADVTVECTFSPFSRDISLFWIKTENLDVNNSCVNKPNPYVLTSDRKYSIRSILIPSGPEDSINCTKVLSLTIHEFATEDEGSYSCASLLCKGSAPDLSSSQIRISGDRETATPLDWLFGFVGLPLLLIVVSLAISSVLVYAYKVRLIRWYISWRVEEPVGDFEYDLCICTAEEYDRTFVDKVSSELYDMFEDEKVLWSEKDPSILAGRSHFVNATEILGQCRKFIFVVDERFADCFFCKQLMEMAVERSSVKNWNIILPVKWNQRAIVPDELLVYRYVEKEGNENFESEVGNFMVGRNVPRRNRRTTDETEMNNLNVPLV